MKKIFIIFIILLFSLNTVFADDEETTKTTAELKQIETEKIEKAIESAEALIKAEEALANAEEADISSAEKLKLAEAVAEASTNAKTAEAEAAAAHDSFCEGSATCLEKSNWMLNVWIFPWWAWEWWDIETQTDSFFTKVIDMLMWWIWVLSVLIMTIWWWYMILHSWKDELLTRWKAIFMSWVYSMIISLSSYIIVKAIVNLIY